MKTTAIRILFSAVVMLALAACAPQAAPQSAPIEAAATELPATPTAPAAPEATVTPAPAAATIRVVVLESFLADIAQNVAGDRLTVKSLIPVGTDPHGYQPTPGDVAAVVDSDLLIVNGADLVPALEDLLKSAGGERPVIEASAGLTSREAREGEEAVMSPEERAEALCAQAPDHAHAEAVEAAADAAAAPLLGEAHDHDHEHDKEGAKEHEHEHEHEHMHKHSLERFEVILPAQGATFGGFVRLEVAEAGDYLLALPEGRFAMTMVGQNEPVDVEEMFDVSCAGLTRAAQMELQAGEYVLALSEWSQGEAFVVFGPAGGHHHHHDHGDPHFWLDPNLVVKYVENIRDALSKADPAGAAIYAANAEAYIARLKELDAWIAEQVAQIPPDQRKLVTNHESFGYFADRYGFQVIGTIVPNISPMAQPSAQQLARLVDRVREAGVKAIFLETGTNPKLAEQLAQETGIRVVTELYSHSITDASGPAPTYLDMMRYNTRAIVEALRP